MPHNSVIDPQANFRSQSPFVNDMLNKMRTRGMSPRTKYAYVHYVADFIFFCGERHPLELGAEEVTRYLSHLATKNKVAAATVKVAEAAILFYYKHCANEQSS